MIPANLHTRYRARLAREAYSSDLERGDLSTARPAPFDALPCWPLPHDLRVTAHPGESILPGIRRIAINPAPNKEQGHEDLTAEGQAAPRLD
jgi:hypothetical protein